MKRALVLAVSAAACVNRQSLVLPPIDDPSSVLLVADNAERTGVYAFRTDGAPELALTLDHETSLLVLAYPYAVSRLGIEPGWLELDPLHVRPLPTPIAASFAATPDEDFAAITVDAAQIAPAFKRARIPLPSDEECAMARGCYTVDEDRVCLMPCGDQEPPATPSPPVLPDLDCDGAPGGSSTGAWSTGGEPLPKFPSESGLDGLLPCRPVRPSSCNSDQVWYPGTDACEAVTRACPTTSRWSEEAGVDAIHVDPLASGPADGSELAPYATIGEAIGEALLHVQGTATIALSPGRYEEVVLLPSNVTLLGACDATSVRQLVITGAGVRVRDLTVQVSGAAPLEVRPDASAELRNLIVRPPGGAIASIDLSATTTLAHTLIDAPSGVALVFHDGVHVLDALEIRAHAERGLYMDAGHVRATRLAISAVGEGHQSITVTGGLLDVDGADIRNTQGAAVIAAMTRTSPARIVLDHIYIGGIRRVPLPDQTFASAIGIELRLASARVTHAMLEDIEGFGFVSADGELAVEDTIVARIHEGSTDAGYFMFSGVNTTLSSKHVAMLESDVKGLAFGDRGQVTLEDVVMAGVRAGSGALQVHNYVKLALSRALLFECDGRAVLATFDPTDDPHDGLTMFDVEIAHAPDGCIDLGSAKVSGARIALSDCAGFGITAKREDSRVVLSDVSIHDVGLLEGGSACEVPCPGNGLFADQHAHLSVDRFFIDGAEYAGVGINNAEVDLSNGTIAGEHLGISGGGDVFELGRLLNQVAITAAIPLEVRR